MLHVTPLIEPPLEDEGPRWPALLASAGFHLLLVLLLVVRTAIPENSEADASATPLTEEQQQERQQELALAPMPPFRPEPDRPRQPPPPEETRALGPDSDNPDARIPQEQGPAIPPPDDIAPSPEQGDAAEEPAPGPPTADRITRAEESRQTGKLQPPTSPWGPARTLRPLESGDGATAPTRTTAGAMGRAGASNVDSRGWRPSFPEAAGQCVEIPDFGTNPDGTPVLAAVLGLVKDDRGFPLPNAHLQLIGHNYSTFSDHQGRYRLEFNPKLLERCRIQYIRVTADGYSGANLTLSVGRQVQSDDVILRRK